MSKESSINKLSTTNYDYEFERIDLRRTWLVLGAIDALNRATVTSISNDIGFNKSTVQRIVERLHSNELPSFILHENDAQLKVENWGVLNKKIIKEYYNEYLLVRS